MEIKHTKTCGAQQKSNKEGISMNQCPQQKSKRFQINYHKKYQNKNKLSPKSVEGKKQ